MNVADTTANRIHFSELPEGPSDGPLVREWNVYRREVGQWVSEGHEGDWVLIVGDQVVGVWDTELEADTVRLNRFLGRSVLMKQIREWEPILRGGGNHRRWRS